ncbi:MAG: hypothetical protein JWR38_1966 [Mucilaginibacter sp.]|nr:hypothetical protein [Mucilaginibacter sp.]
MKKALTITFLLLSIFLNIKTYGQSNKIGFRYHLTNDIVKDMNTPDNRFRLLDSVLFLKGTTVTNPDGSLTVLTKDTYRLVDMQLCNNSTLYCYINAKDGYLQVDPWSIVANNCKDTTGTSTKLNAYSKNSLIIRFPRKLIGDPTKVLKIAYDAWILNISTLGVKFRPSVTDTLNVKHPKTATGSNLNLGLTFGHSWGFTSFNNRTNNSYSFTLSGGLGFSTADLSKEIVNKHIDKGVGSELILSPSINTIFARNDIGILLAVGMDFMTGKQASSWAYQGKPYFGLGISAGFKL